MPANNGTSGFNLDEVAAKTGQTPHEILAAGQMEGEYFPGARGGTEDRLFEEIGEMYNMLEDYVIQQEALVQVLESKGIFTSDELDRAITQIIDTEDSELL